MFKLQVYIDPFHYKALQQIFHVKSLFYHSVLRPSLLAPTPIFCPSLMRPFLNAHRRGAPGARWLELALAEASHTARVFSSPPIPGYLQHSFYQRVTIVELKHFSSTSMKQWYSTTRYAHFLLPIAEERDQWKLIRPRVKLANQA